MKNEKELLDVKDGGFLQSEEWAFFQEAVGNKTVKLKIADEFSANMIEYTLPVVGSYFFIPRGPIFFKKGFVEKCVDELLQIAKKENVGWIRIEPQTSKDLTELKSSFEKLGFGVVKSKKNHEPAQTLMLDLKKSKENLLSEMKSKTRYNIRLASKKGVEIEKICDEKAVETFIQLSKTTAKRDGIEIHSESYYRKMVKSIPTDMLSLYMARFEGKVIATALVSFCGSVATYLHGASSNENRNVMAPHLLQWTIILDAKKNDFLRYDFGGTKIEKDGNGELLENNWTGISKFKTGFSPKSELVSFPGCWDVVLDDKKYYAYKILQNISDLLHQLKMKIKKNVKMV